MVNTENAIFEFQPDGRISKNGLRRNHWRTIAPIIQQLREDAFILGLVEREEGWVTPDRCTVAVKQFWCGKAFDWDGLATLCGPVIDGLVDAGAMPVDDDPAHVVEYTMTAERVATRAESRVAVTVTPVSE